MLNATPDGQTRTGSPRYPQPNDVGPQGPSRSASAGFPEAPEGRPSATKAIVRSGRPATASKTDRRATRRELYDLLLYQHAHSTRKSQRLCLKAPIPGTEGVLIGKRGDKSSLAQVVSCGGCDCAWCGVRWSEQRAALLGLAITVHVVNGGFVVMVTYTLKHGKRDRLDDLWATLTKALAYATNGHKSTRALLDDVCIGYVWRKETTHGDEGWHPHLHFAYFVREGKSMRDVDALVAAQQADLESYFRKHAPGNWSSWSRKYGVRVSEAITADQIESVGESVARYMAKDAARELTATATKKGRRMGNRTSAQLLRDAAAGDEHAGRLYATYELAMMGKKRMRWSDGLAEQLLPAELAMDAVEDLQVRGIAVLPRPLHDALRYSRWEKGIGVTDLLDVADDHRDDDEAFLAIAWLCAEHDLPEPIRPATAQKGGDDDGEEVQAPTHDQDAVDASRPGRPGGRVWALPDGSTQPADDPLQLPRVRPG